MIPGTKPRPRRRLALAISLGVAGALLAALLLAGAAPDWAPPRPAPDAHAAETFEHAVIRQLTAVRDEDPTPPTPPAPPTPGDPVWASLPWSVSLTDDDLCAWLAHRLEPWALNRGLLSAWPTNLSRPLVVCSEGVLHIGVRLGGPQGRLAHFSCIPRIADDGALWLTPTAAGVGRLRLPTEWVLRDGLIGRGADAQTAHLLACLRGERPLAARAIIPLEGRRRVRILDLSPRPGRLEVRCRTELVGDRD